MSLVSETLLVCSPARSNNILLFQVQKAQIEKAEIKADMTKERLQLSQDLLLERERAKNLEETVRLLKEQAQIYQVGQLQHNYLARILMGFFLAVFKNFYLSCRLRSCRPVVPPTARASSTSRPRLTS